MAEALRILHLGLGAFHRAHQAAVLQRLHDAGDRRWRLLAGNLRDDQAGVEAALRAQGGYTLETVAPDGVRAYQWIDAIEAVLPFTPGHATLVAAGADPDTRIVSFTVTEAGYALGPDDALDLALADVQTDVQAHRTGVIGDRTLYGVLAAIAATRRRDGAGPVSFLSCDNLRHNGRRTRAALRRFLEAAGDTALLAWVDANARFPATMVDRITPRPDAGVAARVAVACGRVDGAAVMSERFLQWVVEEDFIAGRPAWEAAGVEMTADVSPYEEAKIRILNAGHSVLAWAGALRGHDAIHDAVADPAVLAIARDYLTHQVLPALGAGPIDLEAYRDVVLSRFANAALGDTVERVASDSHAKFPGFVLPTVRDRLRDARRAGLAPDPDVGVPAALLLAFLQRWHAGVLPFAYRDQAMAPERVHALCAAADPVAAFCAEPALWGELAGDARVVDVVRAASRSPALQALAEATSPAAVHASGRA